MLDTQTDMCPNCHAIEEYEWCDTFPSFSLSAREPRQSYCRLCGFHWIEEIHPDIDLAVEAFRKEEEEASQKYFETSLVAFVDIQPLTESDDPVLCMDCDGENCPRHGCQMVSR